MKNPIAYSPNGKEIFPRPGMIVPVGSLVCKDRGQWETLVEPMFCEPKYDVGNPYDQGPARKALIGFKLCPFTQQMGK